MAHNLREEIISLSQKTLDFNETNVSKIDLYIIYSHRILSDYSILKLFIILKE